MTRPVIAALRAVGAEATPWRVFRWPDYVTVGPEDTPDAIVVGIPGDADTERDARAIVLDRNLSSLALDVIEAAADAISGPTFDYRTSASRALFDKAMASPTQEVTVTAQMLRVLLPQIEHEAVSLAVTRPLDAYLSRAQEALDDR